MVSITTRRLMMEIKQYRIGIMVGVITGLAAAKFAIDQGADLNTIIEGGKGLLDPLLSRNAPIEIAQTKLYGAFAFIGAVVGYIADKVILMIKKR